MKLGVFEDGFPTAFYDRDLHGDNIPADAIEITDEQWLELINNQGMRRFVNGQVVPYTPPAEPAPPYRISKTTPWYRMTPEEARIMDAVMSETDAQMKQIYMAAQYLSSGDPLWQTLHQLIADNLTGGATRANQLLAPEN